MHFITTEYSLHCVRFTSPMAGSLDNFGAFFRIVVLYDIVVGAALVFLCVTCVDERVWDICRFVASHGSVMRR